jgi:hypothetical protein
MRAALLVALALFAQKNGPPYSATPVPPPRGEPAPNQGHIPPVPPDRDYWEFREHRWPILEGQARKEAAQRARQEHVEVYPANAHDACNAVSPEGQTECPVRREAGVAYVVDIAGGVRVGYRPDVSSEDLQQMFVCQKSLAAARPDLPTTCSFIDASTKVNVLTRNGHAVIELKSGNPDVLREQVRTAIYDEP